MGLPKSSQKERRERAESSAALSRLDSPLRKRVVRHLMTNPYNLMITALPDTPDGAAEVVIECNGRIVASTVMADIGDPDQAGKVINWAVEQVKRMC